MRAFYAYLAYKIRITSPSTSNCFLNQKMRTKLSKKKEALSVLKKVFKSSQSEILRGKNFT